MATRTETDMRSFEGALDEKWCHITPVLVDGRDDSHFVCGMPVDEPSHPDCADVDERCTSCGRRCCPDCERIWRERYA